MKLITWWHKGGWEHSELRTASPICSRDGIDAASQGITFSALQRVARDLEGRRGLFGGTNCYSKLNFFMHPQKTLKKRSCFVHFNSLSIFHA